MRITPTHCLLVVMVLCSTYAAAVQAQTAQSQLFPADPDAAVPLIVELQLPLNQLRKLKPEKVEEFDAVLTLEDGIQLPLQVSPRGKSRREECSFPPLRLDFKKKALEGTVFEGQNKLKMVTHCSSRLARGGYLAAEMLAYRLLNLFTDSSFRVRALEVTYVNTDKADRETFPAFLIEHKKDLAKRVGGTLIEVERLSRSRLDPHYATVVNLFSLMVANTDYSLLAGPEGECCHNMVPIETEQVLTVPYDFDATGLVNAPYSYPSPAVKIKRVTQRLYRGFCEQNDIVPEVAAQFLSKQEQILALVETFEDIPGLKKERVTKYLGQFFETIADPKKLNSKVLKRCR
jgi:hypothetical protein